jgi:2-polyprenyl-3-methyl-5-hydroxy-6-metoxy-1,4-benzoquinol methylase
MKCIICESSQFKGLYNKMLLQCNSCNFITANIQLSSNEVFLLYNNDYFTGKEYYNYILDKTIIQKNFKKRLDKINKFYPSLKMNRILEIGCAYGFFGQLITKKYCKEYIGYDVSKEAIEYGKSNFNLSLYTDNYLDTIHKENFYSDVFLWDVIEHLKEPELYLKKIAEELCEGGRIYLTTGDISRFIPKIQGKKWRLIHPPTHLHYFSKKTITKILNNNGFEIIDISYPSIFRSIKLIFYSLFILNKKDNTLKNKILKSIPQHWSFPLNTFDIMFVIAEKRK